MSGGLTGDLVRLRARHEADVPILDAELQGDVAADARRSRRAWRPISPGARALCHYGFVVLGLHRIQIDTLTDNHAMIHAAEKAGFQREVVHRDGAWILGEFADEVAFGLLEREWNH